jgi:hypothetical protein
MKIYKYKLGEFETTLQSIFVEGEKVFRTFDVLALDYRVNDVTKSKVIVTPFKLILTYDDVIEVYDLKSIDLFFNDVSPSFTLQGLILEGNFDLSSQLEERIVDIRNSENRVIFSFQEENSVPKDIMLRKDFKLETNMRTWAMGQTVINAKNGVMNRGLDEMLSGYFGTLDTKDIMKFIYIFLGYFLLKVISVSFLPGFVNTILDVTFWVVLGFVVYTMYKTAKSSLKRFENVYLSYRQ